MYNFLQIKNLSVGYDSPLLTGINLKAEQGDLIGLIGKNGAGKTTLLKTLAGILPVIQGDLLFNDLNLNTLSSKQRANITSVVLNQKFDIPVKVYDFLRMGRYLYTNFLDKNTIQDHNALEEVIEKLQIRNLLDRPIDKLSDGEHQKVIIGRALIQETPVLLLDEPTTHLDLENKALIMNLLIEISMRQNKTIILSSHDINLLLPKLNKFWFADGKNVKEINSDKIENIFNSIGLKFDKRCNIFRLT